MRDIQMWFGPSAKYLPRNLACWSGYTPVYMNRSVWLRHTKLDSQWFERMQEWR